MPTKVLEKIRRWEYIDLSTLLDGVTHETTNVTVSHEGQLLVLGTSDRPQPRKKAISDITTWLQAYTRLMAALVSAESTKKEESVGLVAHLHLILQLHKDLAGSQWLRYDQDYREWAAARGVKIWGDLNLAIYGRCLSYQQPSHPLKETIQRQGAYSGDKRKKGVHSTEPLCYNWNFGRGCNRSPCLYSHACLHCGGAHRAKDCHFPSKRSKQ